MKLGKRRLGNIFDHETDGLDSFLRSVPEQGSKRSERPN